MAIVWTKGRGSRKCQVAENFWEEQMVILDKAQEKATQTITTLTSDKLCHDTSTHTSINTVTNATQMTGTHPFSFTGKHYAPFN